jgi:CRISPR-associated protein Cas2
MSQSVFECSVNEMQFVLLRRRLLDCINTEEDNLRIYRLVEPRERYVEAYGKNLYVDFNDPLVL